MLQTGEKVKGNTAAIHQRMTARGRRAIAKELSQRVQDLTTSSQSKILNKKSAAMASNGIRQPLASLSLEFKHDLLLSPFIR